jgi:hypothetical protein
MVATNQLNTVPFGGISQIFWRNILHSALGSKSSSSKELTENWYLLLAYFMIGRSTFHPTRWRQHTSPKCHWISPKLHRIITMNNE